MDRAHIEAHSQKARESEELSSDEAGPTLTKVPTEPFNLNLPGTASGPYSTSTSDPYLEELDVFDHSGQSKSEIMKPRVKATVWKDESSPCFEVNAKGVCVARRQDNNMINATQLLNVTGMSKDCSDDILQKEEVVHVVKNGPMHLKGVWLPFDRALDIANKEKITEELYPLFEHDIESLLDHQKNVRPGDLDALNDISSVEKDRAELRSRITTSPPISEVDIPGNDNSGVKEASAATRTDALLLEAGPIGSLFTSIIGLLKLILIDIENEPDMSQHYQSLESISAALFFWGTDLRVRQGELDEELQNSIELRDTCLMVLVSIGQFLCTCMCLSTTALKQSLLT